MLVPLLKTSLDWMGAGLELLFPKLCAACSQSAVVGSVPLCSECLLTLPATHFDQQSDNALKLLMDEQLETEWAAALYYYASPRTQALIHSLKYDYQPHLGTALGQYYGEQLRQSATLPAWDALVPVPLHPKKKRIRGYNQSSYIAKGLARSLQLPVAEQILVRQRFTVSQTLKNSEERLQNVKDAFALAAGANVAGKHFLIVDDVVTTGSTFKNCASPLLAAGAKISVLALATTLQP